MWSARFEFRLRLETWYSEPLEYLIDYLLSMELVVVSIPILRCVELIEDPMR